MHNDTHPMHIDATFMPLCPGKVLVNAERVGELPPILKDWEVLVAPPPCMPADVELHMSSRWISMNIVMLDERTVVVEEHERDLIDAFKR